VIRAADGDATSKEVVGLTELHRRSVAPRRRRRPGGELQGEKAGSAGSPLNRDLLCDICC
jgi:hypothetical protein